MMHLYRPILFALVFIEGAVLMGYEILASRYLAPYFGGGIETWACLISTMLIAMSVGYLIGGYIADRSRSPRPLILATGVAALYLVAVSVLARPWLGWLVSASPPNFGLTMLAATGLVAVPVGLMSFWSPFAIRMLLRDTSESGRMSGRVYSVATLGNVTGALGTAFVLFAIMGSQAITLVFATTLAILALICVGLRRAMSTALVLACAAVNFWPPGQAMAQSIDVPAEYPEGVHWLGAERLAFTEMSMDRVRIWSADGLTVFWSDPGCAPTGLTSLDAERLAVACHVAGDLVVIGKDGAPIARLSSVQDARPLGNPNDISSDGAGGAFLSDSGTFAPDAPADGRVLWLSPQLELHEVATDLHYPNGVAFDPATNSLFVAEHLGRRVLRFQLEAANRVVSRTTYFDFAQHPETAPWMTWLVGPDGIRLLPNGALAVAVYGMGRIGVIDRCLELHLFAAPAPYVTSVGELDGRLAIAAATDIRRPHGGVIRIGPLPDTETC